MTHAALIFSHSITPRLQYIVSFLSEYYGHAFRLTSDEEKYIRADDACKINYSYHRVAPGEIFIHSHALLSESSIRQVKVECFNKEPWTPGGSAYPAFFRTEGDAGFDLFAAVFYLITRYEEYLPHQKDSYGRFAHEQSAAFRNGFLHLPLVNIWLEDLRYLLQQKNETFASGRPQFQLLPTYDIDMAWSFRYKGFGRNAAALAGLLAKAKFRKLASRIRVLRGKKQDPYDAYEWMDAMHKKYKLKPIYFFLMAKERGRYDKNIAIDEPHFRELVRSLSAHYEAGLHPSWASGDLPSLLTGEKHALEQLIDRPVTASRQHYIRFTLPVTYQRLSALGIQHDHSMGYGSINGFRASIARPYYWFDLKQEQATKLLVHPFCFMDANAYYEEKLSPEAALEELQRYRSMIRSVGGTMITVWHNSFLGSDEAFAGWKEVYYNFNQDFLDFNPGLPGTG